MKTLLIIVILITTNFAFAGNGGGTMSPMAKNIIFKMGEREGKIKFALGELIGQDWIIKNKEVPKIYLKANPILKEALENSETLKTWIELKK